MVSEKVATADHWHNEASRLFAAATAHHEEVEASRLIAKHIFWRPL